MGILLAALMFAAVVTLIFLGLRLASWPAFWPGTVFLGLWLTSWVLNNKNPPNYAWGERFLWLARAFFIVMCLVAFAVLLLGK